jgi:endo-1,3-1,4-beta-glycanase ExoK
MLRRIFTSLTLACCVLTAPAKAEDAREAGASFVDRFEHLDTARWRASDGWTNGDHQNCMWSAANVKVGRLAELSLADQPNKLRSYTCAELQTLALYGYGAYEVRLRAAPGPGMNTAFFTYTGPPHGRPHDEIDFEFLGKAPRGVQANYFRAGKSHERFVAFDYDATATTNTYAFVWLPDSIRWFANGKLIHEVRRGADVELPAQAQHLYISLWNGSAGLDAWLGHFSYPGTPLVATYEYVAFTRMGEACQFPESIVCRAPGIFAR